MTDCVFCRIAAGEIPARLVYEDDRTIAFLDIAPAARGHVLVVPRAHSSDIVETSAPDLAAVATVAQEMTRRALTRLPADGVNVLNACRAAAGQTVFHTHVHVIPRFDADRFALPWTPQHLPNDEADDLQRLLTGP